MEHNIDVYHPSPSAISFNILESFEIKVIIIIIIIIYGLNTSIWKKIFPIKSVTHH